MTVPKFSIVDPKTFIVPPARADEVVNCRRVNLLLVRAVFRRAAGIRSAANRALLFSWKSDLVEFLIVSPEREGEMIDRSLPGALLLPPELELDYLRRQRGRDD